MCYTFNKETLLAQFDKELVRASCAASTMTDYELETAYTDLYVARAIAQTATMSRIIGVVWYIYGDEIDRRHNYAITCLSISSILSK